MHARLHRSVLAHELAHAAFDDVPTRFGPVHSRQERRAEEWAALRLITVADYRHAEELHAGHVGAIAIELGVMMTIVHAFRSLLERHGDSVYVGGRIGAGQWTRRVQVT